MVFEVMPMTEQNAREPIPDRTDIALLFRLRLDKMVLEGRLSGQDPLRADEYTVTIARDQLARLVDLSIEALEARCRAVMRNDPNAPEEGESK
jgi:hypothetical protein